MYIVHKMCHFDTRHFYFSCFLYSVHFSPILRPTWQITWA
uniref:Uncharacterized protein n=1 Tax=Amphimedon queenslandica TaxID=400682 RepID=A0A1X7T7B1_AMPQE